VDLIWVSALSYETGSRSRSYELKKNLDKTTEAELTLPL